MNLIGQGSGSVEKRIQRENIRNYFLSGGTKSRDIRPISYSISETMQNIMATVPTSNGRGIGTRVQSMEWCNFQ